MSKAGEKVTTRRTKKLPPPAPCKAKGCAVVANNLSPAGFCGDHDTTYLLNRVRPIFGSSRDIGVGRYGADVEVTLTGDVDLTFDHLKRLSVAFGTTDINVGSYEMTLGDPPSEDYGAMQSVLISIRKVTKP